MSNTNLGNSEHRQIERIGDTVHRPTHWWTSSVHDLLNYLEKVGFAYSPRVLGFDDQGREVLSYIEGESGKAGWFKILSDDGLANFARLLTDYHKAIAGYKPPKDAEWAYSPNVLNAGQIMCHGDFGPWNIAWDGEKPVGILDWDLVLPANPEYDIFYALEYATPFRDDDTALSWHHFSEVPDRSHRIGVFLKAYGVSIEPQEIVDGVVSVQRQGIAHEKYLAERGLQPQVDWIKEGELEKIEQRAQWSENNRSLFL